MTLPPPAQSSYESDYPDWKCSGGYAYKAFKSTPRTYWDAKFRCEDQGAELASMDTSEQIDFIQNSVFKALPTQSHIWVGLSEARLLRR